MEDEERGRKGGVSTGGTHRMSTGTTTSWSSGSASDLVGVPTEYTRLATAGRSDTDILDPHRLDRISPDLNLAEFEAEVCFEYLPIYLPNPEASECPVDRKKIVSRVY